LRGKVGVLGGAAAADTEAWATGLAAAGGLVEEARGTSDVETLAAGHAPHGRARSGQRAFDEPHFAVGLPCDAATLGVEALDLENQFFQSDRNSRQCGWVCFSMNARKGDGSLS